MLVVAVLVAAACSASSPVRSAQTASAARTSPTAAASNRNLAIVSLKGSNAFVVRDITDINHPTTISTFDLQDYGSPQFVGGTDVAYTTNNQLVSERLDGSSQAVLAGGTSAFTSTKDGMTVAYISVNKQGDRVAQLHTLTSGQDNVIGSVPAQYFAVGCESASCGDTWDVRLLYSASGAKISFVQMLPVAALRIWASDGTVLESVDGGSATMSVWSGDSLYWRDGKGVEMWRGGSQTLLLPGVSWIRPHASPAGGQIVYETRDAGSGTAHVYLLDTVSQKVRQLATSRSEPAFLNAHLVWYQGERPCPATDPHCAVGPTTTTGMTYVYDLQDGSETESTITGVFDIWPHPA